MHQPLSVVAKILEENDFDSMPICINNRLVGMLTIRDIALKAEQGRSLAELTIEELMITGVRFVFEDQTVDFASDLMNEHQLSRLMVVNRNDQLVGIVTLEDIMTTAQYIHSISPIITTKVLSV